jgi:hypothetical protein
MHKKSRNIVVVPNNAQGRFAATGRIRIITDTPLWMLKLNDELISYFESEPISIEQNDLNCIVPVKIGSCENIVAQAETGPLYAARLKDQLPSSMPAFQLSIQRLRINMGDRCKVLMMTCAPDNVNIFITEMKQLISRKLINFFMWQQYANLLDDQIQTIIDLQDSFTSSFRGLTISGFIDYDVEIPMQIYNGNPDPQRKPHFLENVSVNSYIKNHVISGDGTPLFFLVYPTINNTKELIMELHHMEEAREWAALATGELCRKMDENSINLVFEDPNAAAKEVFNEPWVPYYRNRNIPTTPSRSRSRSSKQARATTPAQTSRTTTTSTSSITSYASIVHGNPYITPDNKTLTRSDSASLSSGSHTRNPHIEVIEIPDTPKASTSMLLDPPMLITTTLPPNPPNPSNVSSDISMDAIAKHIAAETAKIRNQKINYR